MDCGRVFRVEQRNFDGLIGYLRLAYVSLWDIEDCASLMYNARDIYEFFYEHNELPNVRFRSGPCFYPAG